MAIKSFYETAYGLSGNPFPGGATYAEDAATVYVPETFGDQRQEFLRKFVLAPLEDGQPLLGAVWSVVPGDPTARGFGKSTLMGEEAKRINTDFGLSTLIDLGVDPQDAADSPILAGYVSFNTKAQGGIANMDAAAFQLLRFMLRGAADDGTSTHQRVRERAAAALVAGGVATPGNETEAILDTVRARFRQLAVSIDIRNLLEEYLYHLAGPSSEALDRFLSDEVGTWHHDRNGLKYLQIFVMLADIAGIHHLTFFIDQVEDFTSSAGAAKIRKNVKILRDVLLETEPFATRASFVLQLHPQAWDVLRDAWIVEDLRSLAYDNPLNAPVVVVLKGLETFESARLLAERMLNHPRYALPNRVGGVAPFDDGALRLVWEQSRRVPRHYLSLLNRLLALGKGERVRVLDEDFVKRKLSALPEEDEETPSPSRDTRQD